MMTVVDAEFWRGKRVLLTGHTGFKGSWLSLWLQSLGAELHGLALVPPTTPNLFTEAGVAGGMASTIGDIRDYGVVHACMSAFRPDIVVHMAAQSLVRLSYAEPVATYGTNVMGTVHILEAARKIDTVRCIVNVTTDKCYENREWVWAYRENEPMGGYDPYSNSKGCAELVTSAYRRSFFRDGSVALASARAGNAIGGGDWAPDRLVPDILRSFERGEPVVIRSPGAIRPWQHVLEPLSGYLILAQRLWSDCETFADAWNFGPVDDDARAVQWIVEHLAAAWGQGAEWKLDEGVHPHEACHIRLDISNAKQRLGWRPSWNLETALDSIVLWHRAWLNHEDMRAHCTAQIKEYTSSMNGRHA